MDSAALRDRAGALSADLTAWRRHLHQRPELGFEERETAAFVRSRLELLELEIHDGIAETGVVGILRASSASRPAVLLRADMDALPIQEVSGREYGSRVPNRMHACGHDGHTAMLLGAATLLAEARDALSRDVVFCFQPAEEGLGGGRRMIEEGVLELVETERVYGLHLWSPFEAGTVQVRSGPSMAAQDEFSARIVGRGGHGAMPHLNLDPIVGAAHAVTAMQTAVSRFVDPLAPVVATVGSLHAGSAPNITPDEARMEGTLRSFDETVRVRLQDSVRQAMDGAARSVGCRLEFELRPGFPALVNHSEAVDTVREVGSDVFGAAQVREHAPMMPAEDFAYFLQQRTGAFIFVGAGNVSRGITAPHHSPEFDIDESVLPLGAELLARLALH